MIKKPLPAFAKNNLFRIISIFFVFAILSNIIYIPCYFYVRRINERTMLDHQQTKLEDGMQMLSASVDTLLSMPGVISVGNDYNTIYYERADFGDLHLNRIRRLCSATFSHFEFISEFGLTMHNSLLFSKSRIYYDTPLLAYDQFFFCDREDYLSEFSGAYCVLPAARFSTTRNASSYDAITVALRYQKPSHMYLFMHYSLDDLFSLFADDDLLNNCYLALYAQNQLLAEKGAPFTESFQALTAKINNQFGISVVLQMPDSYIAQNLQGMTHLIRVFISVVVLAAILWVLVFSVILWRPFYHIHRVLHLSGHLPENTESLVESIASLGQQVSYYKETLERQQERNRMHLFEKALYRGVHNDEALQVFTNAFPDFPKAWKLVMLQFTSDGSSISSDTLQSVLDQFLQTLFPSAFILPQDPDSLLLLVAEEDISAPAMLQTICEQIQQKHMISVSFITSNTYDEISSLPEALQEIEYEELSLANRSTPATISIAQLQTIYHALQCGDAQTASTILQRSASAMIAQNDLFSAKHSYRMLGYILVTLKMEFSCISDIPIPVFSNENIQQYFLQDLPAYFVAISERMKQQKAQNSEQLESDIVQYIQDNLTNPQLGVTMVAEQFNISATTLQKRMNAACNSTFSAYVESVRMEKAQQLLRETADTVQEIAEAVGYVNANSFYKAYKRRYGESPLAYRNRAYI